MPDLDDLERALRAQGFHCSRRTGDEPAVICSTEEDGGNSFWAYKGRAGFWYLCTWTNNLYRIPAGRHVEAIAAALNCSQGTLYLVPPQVVSSLELEEVDWDPEGDLPA